MHERTFSNGFELIVKPTSTPVAALQVWVDVGSIDETPAQAGYSHFLEHMLFKGTQKRTTADIAGAVEGSGGEMNAFTSFEYTVYHITIASQRWKLANEILADMVLGSIFKPSEFNPEKAVILEEIRRCNDSPDRNLYYGVYDQVYGNAGYGRPVIGFPKTVAACTSASLKKYWKNWYSPNLMTLVVCGDVDPNDVEKNVEKLWGKPQIKAPRKRRRESGFRQALAKSRQPFGARTFPVNSIKWVGALPACNLLAPELPALDISAMVLGQGETSRLHRRLFRDEGLVTSVSAGVWAPAGTGMYTFDVETPVEKSNAFRKVLQEEVERFCEHGPTSEELERAKVQVESERVYSAQSMDGLAHRLGFMKTSIGNPYFDIEYLSKVQALNPQEVRDTSRTLLDQSTLTEFALVPQSFDLKTFWSDLRPSKTKNLKSSNRKKAEPDPIDKISLGHGVELNLIHKSDSPILSVHVCALAGLRVENKKNAGIGSLLADTWEKGPAGWDVMKVAEFLESKAARFEAFSGKNSIGISATMLSHTANDVLPLFAETLFNPELNPAEFEREKRVALEDIKTFDEHLERVVSKKFSEALFAGHPYSQPTVGFIDSVSTISIDDLRSHYETWVAQAPLTISVCGKFDHGQILSTFEKFARARSTTLHTPPSLAQHFPTSEKTVTETKNREQSHLIVGFPGSKITDKDRFDLKVLTTILGGQSGRLFIELRDKMGLCYTVAPTHFEGIERGYFAVYMGCDPSKREKAYDGIRRELDKLVRTAPSTSEIKRAVEFLTGRHFMEMQLNSSIASTVSFNSMYGLGADEHLRVKAALELVTRESVHKLSKKLFQQPAVTSVII